MAAIEDVLKGNIVIGVMVGVAASVLAPVVLAAGKPLLRSAIKTGILMYERGKESVAELKELAEDAAAEAHTELVKSQQAEANAAATMAAANAAASSSISIPVKDEEAGPDTAGAPV